MNRAGANAPARLTDAFRHARASELLRRGMPVVVSLSGGRDSVCLLDVACELAGADVVSAVHINYGLRSQAGGDQALAQRVCDELGVALEVHAAPAAPSVGNLHAWAREIRRSHGLTAARDRDAVLALGHTATDQAETVLYRLAASQGRRALLGMSPRNGRIVRPLLTASRAETVDHCQQRGLPWCEDASNDDARFARARVRHGLVPALEAIHPAAIANIVETAARLRDEEDVLAAIVDERIAGRDAVPVAELAALAPALARLAVRALAERACGRPCPRVVARVDEILALDGALDLGEGVRAHVADGVLRFGASDGRARPVDSRHDA